MSKTGALESPLEALVFNYLTYGFLAAVNSVWAWIAVVTAAVSLWRIRGSSSLRNRSKDAASSTSSAVTETEEVAPAQAAAPSPAAISGGARVRGGMTKTKLRLYYEGEDFWDNNDEDTEGATRPPRSGQLGGFCGDWERMMEVRMGDLGWYRWQDTAVLNGSVVRLWGGYCRVWRAAALAADVGRFM